MANRVIKDSILTSPSLAKLPIYYQDQWPRWLLLADDWGCFNADPDIIKGFAYPKRKERAKDIKNIRKSFFDAGLLFLWSYEEREWGFFVKWDLHQFCNASGVDDEGQYTKHRRKTPEPPKELLTLYLQEHRLNFDNFRQSPTSFNKVVNPNPNPNPKPILYVEVAKATFDHYMEVFNKNKSQYQYTPKRRAKIEQRARELYAITQEIDKTRELLFLAVNNRKASKFHMGDNPQGKKYVDLADHIFRSQEYTEQLIFEEKKQIQTKRPEWWGDLRKRYVERAKKEAT